MQRQRQRAVCYSVAQRQLAAHPALLRVMELLVQRLAVGRALDQLGGQVVHDLRPRAGGEALAEVQGLSQSEHFGNWVGWYGADGAPAAEPPEAVTVLYKPWGGHAPAANYLVSDSDFVEVLTEIDIQTPIPPLVQQRRAALGFVFLGCRFNDQLARSFSRQIMKRSQGPHYAVLADEPTRMEARFLAEQGITRIALPLAEAAAALTGAPAAAEPAALAA